VAVLVLEVVVPWLVVWFVARTMHECRSARQKAAHEAFIQQQRERLWAEEERRHSALYLWTNGRIGK
jgi:flagellar biosynthesis/type III secretory pathway M-ring protein FliF/YscJ